VSWLFGSCGLLNIGKQAAGSLQLILFTFYRESLEFDRSLFFAPGFHPNDEIGFFEGFDMAKAEIFSARYIFTVNRKHGLSIAPFFHDERGIVNRRVRAGLHQGLSG